MEESNRGSEAKQEGRRVFVLVLPNVHLIDLAGPVQALYEANGFGARYEVHFVGTEETASSAQGLGVAGLASLPTIAANDWVLVPGIESTTLGELAHVPVAWIQQARDVGARLCSICSGAWILAHSGVLDNRRCTTHWKIADALAAAFPAVEVKRDRLFVRDGEIWTSAGEASGVDMALAMIEEDHDALLVAKVAREMVVYHRRDGSSPQASIYVLHRRHLHPGIHRAQDWLISHPESRPTIGELARIARMSPRNLTRVFRQCTGVSLKEFTTGLKLEVASNLLRNPAETVESVASQCGFADGRQLRRLWQSKFGVSPSEWKHQQFAEG